MPYEFICPRCGGRSYSAAARGDQPCPHCGHTLDASNTVDRTADASSETDPGSDKS